MKPKKIIFMSLKVLKRKAAKQLLISSQTTIDLLYLIMVHNEGNIDKNLNPFIFYRSRENHVSDAYMHTYIRTDGHLNNRVANKNVMIV